MQSLSTGATQKKENLNPSMGSVDFCCCPIIPFSLFKHNSFLLIDFYLRFVLSKGTLCIFIEIGLNKKK